MLDAFIIEEIKRRERQRTEQPRPAIQIPTQDERESDGERQSEERNTPQRGVVHIETGRS